MFQQLECNEETLALFDRSEPQFLHGIHFEMEKRLPHVKFSVYSYKTGENQYFYGYRTNSLAQQSGILCSKGTFVPSEFLEGFEKFQQAAGFLSPARYIQFLAEKRFTDEIINYVEQKNIPVKVSGHDSYFFIVCEEQEKLILDMPTPELPLGYSFGETNPDDAEFITSVWMYATPGEQENTRAKIETFPSSCIYFEGNPVAFELVNVDGSLNHQFVLKEHRRKGLGAAVEIDLAKKCIREGLIVHKNVDHAKPTIIEATKKIDYWTTVKNEDGNYCNKVYFNLIPK